MSARIEPFGPRTPPDPALVSQLHAQLLPDSPVALLGRRFMEEVYYLLLPAAGLVTGAVAFLGDDPAGFVVETDDADGFMDSALRRWRWRIARVVCLSIGASPARLRALLDARRIMSGRENRGGTPEGEILSLGVLPQFRTTRLPAPDGPRLSEALVAGSIERLAHRKVPRVRAVVDGSNLATQLFYRSQGWQLEPTTKPGWRAPTVDFVLELQGSRAPLTTPGASS